MKAIFRPAVLLLNQLRYTTKFLLICVIALGASAVLMAQIYIQSNDALSFVEREQAGLAVLTPSMGVLTLMQQHRGMTAGMLGGDASLTPKVAAKAAALDTAVDTLSTALGSTGAGFGLDATWSDVKAQWPALKAGTPAERGANFSAHTAMVKDMLSLIVDVGTASSLAFDPDAASSNLISILLREAPEMSERLGRLRGFGTGILARGVLTLDDEKALTRQLAQLAVTHAAMVDRLRADAGALGLVTANGGYLTKHSMGVCSTTPPPQPWRHAHPQAEVDALPSRELASEVDVDGSVESAVVVHDRNGPMLATFSVLLADGRRAWGTSGDATLMALVETEEVAGRRAHVSADGACELVG